MVFKLVVVVIVVVGLYLDIPNRAILVFLNIALSSQNLRTFVTVIVLADL